MPVFCGPTTPLGAGQLLRNRCHTLDQQAVAKAYAAWLNQAIDHDKNPLVLTQLAGMRHSKDVLLADDSVFGMQQAEAIGRAWENIYQRGGLRPVPRFHQEGERPKDGEVYVFGSNLAGQATTSQARLACKFFGAVEGIAQGYQGYAPHHSYALPVKDERRCRLPLAHLSDQVQRLAVFSRCHREHRLFIARVGVELGGHQDAVLAPMFSEFDLSRCSVPISWMSYLYSPLRRMAMFGLTDIPLTIKRLWYRVSKRLSQLGFSIHAPWCLPCPTPTTDAYAMAEVVFPQHRFLPRNTQMNQAMCAHLVVGADLRQVADLVLCWTPDGATTEAQSDKSTPEGMAIALANRWQIPIFNLRYDAEIVLERLFLHLNEPQFRPYANRSDFLKKKDATTHRRHPALA